jgi:hypothetical protein
LQVQDYFEKSGLGENNLTEFGPSEKEQVWVSFVKMLKIGDVSSIPIRPYYPNLHNPLKEILQNMRRNADWSKWEVQPEAHLVGDQVHFLLPLQEQVTYCFSFLLESGEWYFQHVECITLRLDKVDSLPTSHFPDLPEEKKAWIREEIRVSEMVRLFQWLLKNNGRSFAMDWFLDGEGYLLAARAWVPFVPVHQAFILYLCWEQASLRGSAVTLVEMNDLAARVQIQPIYFQLYKHTTHLKQQISFEDYRCLFETIWIDRASKAGWDLTFSYQNEICELFFVQE